MHLGMICIHCARIKWLTKRKLCSVIQRVITDCLSVTIWKDSRSNEWWCKCLLVHWKYSHSQAKWKLRMNPGRKFKWKLFRWPISEPVGHFVPYNCEQLLLYFAAIFIGARCIFKQSNSLSTLTMLCCSVWLTSDNGTVNPHQWWTNCLKGKFRL